MTKMAEIGFPKRFRPKGGQSFAEPRTGGRTREEWLMPIEFYDVKKREKVQIPESEVRKTTYEKAGKEGKINVRYAFRATNEGTNLTKFVKKEDWEALDAPIE
jgi:hypothetical protein